MYAICVGGALLLAGIAAFVVYSRVQHAEKLRAARAAAEAAMEEGGDADDSDDDAGEFKAVAPGARPNPLDPRNIVVADGDDALAPFSDPDDAATPNLGGTWANARPAVIGVLPTGVAAANADDVEMADVNELSALTRSESGSAKGRSFAASVTSSNGWRGSPLTAAASRAKQRVFGAAAAPPTVKSRDDFSMAMEDV